MSSDRTPAVRGSSGTVGTHRAGGSAAADASDPAALRLQVERTRAELADTIEGLVYQLDVPARAKEKVADARTQLRARAADLQVKARAQAEQLRSKAVQTWQDNPTVVVAGGAAAVGVLVTVVLVVRKAAS